MKQEARSKGREAEPVKIALRTRFLLGWTLGACVMAISAGAYAQQNYPIRPLRLIVPLAPGGPSDILARMMAQSMTGGLGQPVVVDNRTGAGGTIGIDIAAKSPPDGYTMLLVAAATYTI